MKTRGKRLIGLAALLITLAFCSVGLAQEWQVYGEAVWRDDAAGQDVVVGIFADQLAGDPLISFGIRLTYPAYLTLNTDPSKTGTDKDTWYFGTTSVKEDYTDVYEEGGTEVVLIGGKLDTGAPTEGVSGERVLLAKVYFSFSTGATMPPTLGITYGRPGSYIDFADNGVPTDPPTEVPVLFEHPNPDFGGVPIVIRERGDANADGEINILDVRALRQKIGDPDASYWVDCNGDEEVNILDVRCLRQKI
jgi:hypothetical protein